MNLKKSLNFTVFDPCFSLPLVNILKIRGLIGIFGEFGK